MLPMLLTVQWSPQSPDLRLKTCLNFTAVLCGIKTTQRRISINIHHGTTYHWSPLVSTDQWSPLVSSGAAVWQQGSHLGNV